MMLYLFKYKMNVNIALHFGVRKYYQTRDRRESLSLYQLRRAESNSTLGERLKVALTDKQLVDTQLRG